MRKLLILLLITISHIGSGQEAFLDSNKEVQYDIIKSYAGTTYNIIVKEVSAKHLAFCFEGETAINYISSQEYIDVILSSGRVIKGQPRITSQRDVKEVDNIDETFGLIPLEESISAECKVFQTYSESRAAAMYELKRQAFEKGCHIVKVYSEIASKGVYAYSVTLKATGYKFRDDLR